MYYLKIVSGNHPNNTYLIYNDKNECLIVDPSIGYELIDEAIIKHQFEVLAVLVTHGHYDHIFSVDYFVNKYNVDVYASKNCLDYFVDPNKNLSKISSNSPSVVKVEAKPIVVTGNFTIGDFNIEMLRTYGHTKTCITFLIDNYAITGDFVFKGTIGRTDFFDSSIDTMYESIRQFSKLDRNIIILPGHGDITTLEQEINHNPHFKKLGIN